MKLEQQVCSLELAKKLKELGAKQNSLFYWIPMKDGRFELLDESNAGNIPVTKDECSAFTVAELGEMLPAEMNRFYHHSCSPRGGSNWLQWYEDEDGDKLRLKGQPHAWLITASTEADARAKMLIYLLENRLVEATSLIHVAS